MIEAKYLPHPSPGMGVCTANGIEAKSKNGSSYKLARALIEAGHDPAEEMQVWNGDILAWKPKPLCWFAQWTCSEPSDGRLHRLQWKPFHKEDKDPEGWALRRKIDEALEKCGLIDA